MASRSFRLFVLSGAAALAASCASSDLHQNAQRACAAENTPAAQMGDCISEMESTLAAARNYHGEPAPAPHRQAPAQHHAANHHQSQPMD